MIRSILAMALVLALLGGGYVWWMFNKPHEDVRKMNAEASYTSEALILEFTEAHGSIDAALFDKVVKLEGEISKIISVELQTVLTFDQGGDYIIQAYLPVDGNDITGLDEGSSVQLKCKYSGYVINDENFFIPADIKLEKCYIEGI